MRHQRVRRDDAEPAGLEVLDRLHQLLAGVHVERPVLRDRLGDRLSALDAEVDEISGPVLVLDAVGDPLGHVPDDVVLVVGSERAGVSEQVRSRADGVLALPMRPGVSSLNLATAAAAALYAWRLSRP